jgi:hypothetical protein
MRTARLKELEELAAKLLETARKLPSGQDHHNALQEIERFRARITALQRLDLRSAQSPQPYDLVTRPCTIDAGRFRWDIREDGRPIQSSMESFATEQEAHACLGEAVHGIFGFIRKGPGDFRALSTERGNQTAWLL